MSFYPLAVEEERKAGGPFRRIVLAIDGSEESRRAVAQTKELAKVLGAEVTVVHFREPAGPVRQETAAHMLALVTRVVNELAGDGITVSADIENSTTLDDAIPIAHVAERYAADLIVVGSRGFSTGRAWIQGSVSHDLIHATRVPILIAR
jgi:nucleotide-binding universal stress UspA family protein